MSRSISLILRFFFFNVTPTTEIYTLSLHDALPIYNPDRGARARTRRQGAQQRRPPCRRSADGRRCGRARRSEEHTSELQSQSNLVCRLLLEKKKNILLLETIGVLHNRRNQSSTAEE